VSKAKTALAKCIGPFCTDFNTKKNYEIILRKFGKKMFSLKSMTKLEDLTVLDYTGGWVGAMTPIPTTAKNVAVFVCSMDNESVVISIL
jgi:hypothetical protein